MEGERCLRCRGKGAEEWRGRLVKCQTCQGKGWLSKDELDDMAEFEVLSSVADVVLILEDIEEVDE